MLEVVIGIVAGAGVVAIIITIWGIVTDRNFISDLLDEREDE